MEHALERIHELERKLDKLLQHAEFIENVVLTIDRRQRTLIDAVDALMRAEGSEVQVEALELDALERIEHPPVDALGLRFDGATEKPPAQVLGAQGVEGGKVMEPAALPPDLEKRLAIVGDRAFQQYCQTACDHGMDPGEHPIKQAARVILSICCVSTPYALAEPDAAARLNAMFARFEAWRSTNV